MSQAFGVFFGGSRQLGTVAFVLKSSRVPHCTEPCPSFSVRPLTNGNVGTSSERLNYWPSIIGISLTGLGFTTIFQSALSYLIDTFTRFSASAVAANTFMRSMFAGAFPLFVIPMYHKTGVDWGSTIFGCIAAVLIPVPFLFFVWGKRIRARGAMEQA